MTSFRNTICCFFLFFVLSFNSNFAQTTTSESSSISPELFGGMEYRSVGPTRGGRSTAVEGIPHQPFTFFMGSTGGGVWKTTDAGTSWENLSDGQIDAGTIGSIKVAPSDMNVIYVGTGSACPRGNVSPGIGLYKTTDGGKNWKFSGLPKVGQIGAIEVHPDNPNLVYVAALGQIFGPNPERGVYRTKDGGTNWELMLSVSDSTGAVDLAMNPHNPREIYASMWRAERKPWTMIDGGKEGGIWKTMDGGDTWKKLSGGLPTGLLGKIGIAVSPAKPERVWAIIAAKNEKDGGVWRSDNSGKTWKRICRNHQLRQRAWYYAHIIADPKDENTVFVCNVNFFKSVDGGKNFDYRIRAPHGDYHDVWINPHRTDIMISANDGGACVSLNGGDTWSSQLNQPTAQFYRVTVDNGFPYRLYAGQQDNSTISIPSHDPGGITDHQHWHSVGGGESGDVGVNAENENILWSGTYSGEITYLNRATGQIRQVTAYPHYTEGTEMRDLKYRWQWNFPIVVSEHDPKTVYHTSNYVHRTRDNGQTWEIISPDLTQQIDEYLGIPGGPIQHDATGVEVYCSIFAFEESPHKAGVLWAGSDDGLVHISKDGGGSWKNITPKGMPQEGTVNKIELSSHKAGKAYVAVYNYRYNDFKPYIYKTENFGESWTSLTKNNNGIPADHFVRCIAEDPNREGLLYAGTEFGMYISFDDGKNWQSFQLNLPIVPITDMEVHHNDLIISTQGRAFWVIDDVTPLHQMEPNLAKADKILFKPRAAYRTNIRGYNLKTHFYLKEKLEPKTPILFEILDTANQVIRTYNSDSKNGLNQIKLNKGFNTIEWDLRHQGPELVKDIVTMVIRNPSPGPRAVPNNYQLRLTIGDWTETHPFELLSDPRWTDVLPADYQSQLELGIEIRDMITESHKRIKNMRSARKQVLSIADLAIKAGHNDSLKVAAERVDLQLSKVEDELVNKAEASQDNINYRRVFSNHIGRLYSVVVNAHQRPTGGSLERYEDLKIEYQGIVKVYDAAVEELKNFQDLLTKNGVGQIILPERL